MDRKKVNSSNLNSVGFDGNNLEIEFNSGAIYQYSGVSQTIYSGLMNANSHGQYFDRNIKKGGYNYRQIK